MFDLLQGDDGVKAAMEIQPEEPRSNEARLHHTINANVVNYLSFDAEASTVSGEAVGMKVSPEEPPANQAQILQNIFSCCSINSFW